MKEQFFDYIKRKIHEFRLNRCKRIIRKYVEKYDKIHEYSFMVYSWAKDEITDYHVIAERSFPNVHVYGTEITRL